MLEGLGIFILIVIFILVVFAAGAITSVALLLKYLIIGFVACIPIIGIYTWLKIGLRKLKSWIYKKRHYPKGVYKP